MIHNEEQRDTPQLEPKGITIDNLGPSRNDDGIEWLDVEKPLDLVDTSEELVYESLIKEMPKKNGYEYMGRNFVGLRRDMHVFVENISYVMDFTILESIESNINPRLSNVVFGWPFVEIACLAINTKYGLMTFTDGIKKITFKTPYDRGCRKPSDLEDGFYRDIIKLRHKYLTGIEDEGEVT
ncbi:hypothetical protein Tco_0844011 [Tanacetum coccineum]